jgi:hypothetical protein
MTEKQWLKSDDPAAMLAFLGDRASKRKCRLMVCELMRRDPSVVSIDDARRSIELGERWADGAAGDEEVAEFNRATLKPPTGAEWMTLARDPAGSLRLAIRPGRRDRVQQGEFLLRECFGNPFRPVSIAPAWRTSDVMLLAGGIYDEKAFDRMPILADALQDAGCNSDEMLNHCRAPGEHVRGCWVLDAVLGKE